MILGIPCLFAGQPRFYIPHIDLDSVIPLAAGREIWGYPKKLAAITIETDVAGNDILWGRMERPAGNPICSAGVRPERPLPVTGETTEGYSMGLRVIPSPEEDKPPSLAELVDVHSKTTIKAHWQGPGWVEFHNHSELDPWYRLEVKRIVSATYRINDMTLGFGRVVKSY